jgi:hypothetical protein
MTCPTRLNLDLGFSTGFGNCPYFLPSCRDPRATLTQTCWVLTLLTDLRLRNLLIKDQREITLLTRSIFGLKRLQNARFGFIRWEKNELVEGGGHRDLGGTAGATSPEVSLARTVVYDPWSE